MDNAMSWVRERRNEVSHVKTGPLSYKMKACKGIDLFNYMIYRKINVICRDKRVTINKVAPGAQAKCNEFQRIWAAFHGKMPVALWHLGNSNNKNTVLQHFLFVYMN